MNVPINTAAALHLDNIAKEQAREEQKQNVKIVKDRVKKCGCSYESPFKDCPQCNDMKQWGLKE